MPWVWNLQVSLIALQHSVCCNLRYLLDLHKLGSLTALPFQLLAIVLLFTVPGLWADNPHTQLSSCNSLSHVCCCDCTLSSPTYMFLKSMHCHCRCSLCKGTGAVGWEGKWSHKEPCPLCVGKRFVECTSCGGHYHRPMFSHIHRTGMDVEDELQGRTEPTKVISGVLED